MPEQTQKQQEIPMGATKWKDHGQKFGYWEYFEKEAKAQLLEQILEEISEYELFEGKGAFKLPKDEQRINDLLKEIQQSLREKFGKE